MSSILLLLEDGEMRPFVQGSGGQIVLTRGDGDDDGTGTASLVDASTLAFTSVGDGDTLTLGNHFLTAEDFVGGVKDADGNVVTKIEVENVPVEVVVEKSGAIAGAAVSGATAGGSPKKKNTAKATKGQGASLSAAERKVCLWPTGTGSTCGKTFTKFDSLKRHLSEAHKGLRPFACPACDKTYGRRDYLQRHLKSHNATYAVELAGGTVGGNSAASVAAATQMVKKVQLATGGTISATDTSGNIVLHVQQPPQNTSGGGSVQIIQPSGSSKSSKGGGSKKKSSAASRAAAASAARAAAAAAAAAASAEDDDEDEDDEDGGLNSPNPAPFFSLRGQLPTAKPMGSKICRWVQNDGTVCGKAFSKLDSLRRHVKELHKGVRPYACNLCDKSYGRRDYLDRHMRTHEKKAKKRSVVGGSGGAGAGDPGDASDGAIDWGPDSGVLMQGDEVPPPPKVVKKKRKDIPPEEKKICLWILEDGTACGKTFTKFDSLKRHVSEAHKGIRPYTCSLCMKTYGRRDYLLRHLRSHQEVEISNISIAKVRNNPSNHPDNHIHNPGAIPLSETAPARATSVSAPAIVAGPSGATVAAALNTSTSSNASSTGLPHINFGTMIPQPQQPVTVLTGATVSNLAPSPIKVTTTSSSASSGGVSRAKKAMEDKKTCKWALENGTVCGKTFSKFDSLRRHVAELHKNIRPFICSICEKSYGRKDYLDRHMKSHMTAEEKATSGGDIEGLGSLDAGDIDIKLTTDGTITGHVVDSDEESNSGSTTAMVVVGDDGTLDLDGTVGRKRGGKRGMDSVGGPITKTMRIIDADPVGIMDDVGETTTTTVVVDTGDAVEDDDDDDDDGGGGVILPSVVTVVSND